MQVDLGPELEGRVRLGTFTLEGVTVREADAGLAAEVDAYCAELRSKFGEGRSALVPGASDARDLYKALGLDPTKYRPSNEALLRRALKGEPLYRINTLVDALNLCSLRLQLPFGLYDFERLEPPVVLRRGRPGEQYEGIRKGAVSVEGRPVLADARGPFGNPSSDSERSMIRLETRRALVTLYAPASCGTARLAEALDLTERTLTRYSGGQAVARLSLPDAG
jgi:DNA/RNA-binding domain of Phe-tRNA-synthetase-like protein